MSMTRVALLALALAVAIVTSLVLDASAAKWTHGCPKARLKRVSVGHGYTLSRFAHVGHDITLHLKSTSRGAFSVEPDGNTVQFTFMPLGNEKYGGAPIPLPPFTVAAVSPTTLTFPVPDTRPLLGRLIVGGVRIDVTTGGQRLIYGRKTKLVILPPMNDMRALTSAGGQVEVLGAVDYGANNMWIPLTFGGFGEGDPIPQCPAPLAPILGFAIDFSMKEGPNQLFPHAQFAKIDETRLYLGDYEFGGVNLYGTLLRERVSPKGLKGKGFTICALNDSLELVMRLPLKPAADRPETSTVVALTRDGSPLTLKFRNMSADPWVAALLPDLREDSLQQSCFVVE